MKQSLRFWFLAWGLFHLAGATALAQPSSIMPMPPQQAGYYNSNDFELYNYAPVPDMATDQLFAPLDLSDYGDGPQPNTGYFFNYDYLRWAIQAPPVVSVGIESAAISVISEPDGTINGTGFAYNSSLTTGQFTSELMNGSRVEGGLMGRDRGFLANLFNISSDERVYTGSGAWRGGPPFDAPPTQNNMALIIFDDPLGAFTGAARTPFGITFGEISAHNHVTMYGGEVMRIWRLSQSRQAPLYAPVVDFMAGVRYIRMQEAFLVQAFQYRFDNQAVPVVQPREFNVNTWSENNLIGPQVGGRINKAWGPFSAAFEGRFCAAFNFQSLKQHTDIDPQILEDTINGLYIPNATTANDDIVEFAPVGEIRFEAAYTVTRKVRIRAGWTGFYMASVARASNLVDWSIGRFGFLPNNRSEIFTNGIHLGVEVNH